MGILSAKLTFNISGFNVISDPNIDQDQHNKLQITQS